MSKFKGTVPLHCRISAQWVLLRAILTIAGDYSYFVKAWDTPKDGLRGFLLRFLASKDDIDQHIAVWTLTQLLESNGMVCSIIDIDRRIQKLILQTPELPDLLRTILRSSASSADEAVDDSDFEDDSGDETLEEGNEVVNLCRTALMSLKSLPPLEELQNHAEGRRVRVEPTTSQRSEDVGTAVSEEGIPIGFKGDDDQI
jgi:hypothetical protein